MFQGWTTKWEKVKAVVDIIPTLTNMHNKFPCKAFHLTFQCKVALALAMQPKLIWEDVISSLIVIYTGNFESRE